MKIKIRKATLQDCKAICEIHVSSIRELTKSHHSDAEITVWSRERTPDRYEKHISERYVIIAETGGIQVGFGTLDLRTGEIVQLYIRPEYARQRIGTKILGNLLGMAKAKGFREATLLSSLNAEVFYANAGFQPGQRCKHFFNGGEIDCIPMKKLLE